MQKSSGCQQALPTARRPVEPGWLQLDLASLDASQAKETLQPVKFGAIYVFAGMTNVDACEDHAELAFQTNARGPSILAAYARELNIPFVYFSTEYLFDGRAEFPGPYREDDVPNPRNVYGASKLAGEKAVAEAYERALIVRTTVVFGEDPQGKNYLYTVLRQLANGIPLRVPQDQVSTPTYNRDLIRATVGLVEAGASGVFHVCGAELLSRLEFAQRIAAHFHLDPHLLQGKDTVELQQRASRPLAAGLATEKLRSLFPHLVPRDLESSLEDCGPAVESFLQTLVMKR